MADGSALSGAARPEQRTPSKTIGLMEPYFLGLDRAMISLGPLVNETFCTYRCQFCYVNGPYPRYAKRSVDEIAHWLATHRDQYKVVYISGDTDSFARPRTAQAIDLLFRIAALDVDVLFTTRYVFTETERIELELLLETYRTRGRLLVPCISVSQLHQPALEPPPVPTPESRLDQVRWFYEQGAQVLLTIRPFIPYVPAREYAEIAYRGGPYSSAILGGDWYVDLDGGIDLRVRRALGIPDWKKLDPSVEKAKQGPLDSTNDGQEWLTYRHPEAEKLVGSAARSVGRNFFMRSSPAIEFLRSADEYQRRAPQRVLENDLVVD
jgi:hypothetical protein